MNIVNYILKLSNSFIGKISRCTERVDPVPDILGKCLTDPYGYGLIFEVMGKSLTDLSRYQESEAVVSEPMEMSEVEWIDLNDDEDLPEEQFLYQEDKGIGLKDFKTLENCISGDSKEDHEVAEVISQLKGTELYEALKENSAIRIRIASLLEKVEKEEVADDLSDMSSFLNTPL